MNERIEHSVSVGRSEVIVQAMDKQYENLLESGAEIAQRKSCEDCTHLALCGLAINILSVRKPGADIRSIGRINTHGVSIDSEGNDICPGGLVEEALRRNQSNEFWLLEADELNNSRLEVRTAQTVRLAAEYVRHIVINKIVT